MAVGLDAREIEVRYSVEAPPILKALTLAVNAGEFIGIVGPNGSGKSTLVRALSRALRPAQGAVLLSGTDLYTATSARQAARQVGVVPQTSPIAFDFTAREVVRMGRSPHLPRRPFASETAADEQFVEEAMRAAGVLELADRIAATLSGGELQRVLIARALAQEPDVLLLDEPTAHLDIQHQMQTLTLARALAHEQGLAVLAVLHDLNLAGAYCDRLVLLHDGRIVAQGTPEEVLTAAHIQQAYGARVWVRCHPASGRPVVLSLPSALPGAGMPYEGEAQKPSLHVVCGGGTGTGLLVGLRRQGYPVTVGGLNAGDTDQEAAEMLGLSYAREAPFSALSAFVIAEATSLMGMADVVMMTDVPFGRANLAGLEAALAARQAGKTVICLQSPDVPFASRDFTGGAATRLWEQLVEAGAVIVPDAEAAMAALASLPA